jgi:hypothetical protein
VPFEAKMWEVDEHFQSFKAATIPRISLIVVGSQSISVELLPIHADCGNCATTNFVFCSEIDRLIAVMAEKPQIQVSRSTNF